jgi:8-oxo-dGTP diphosphatase
VVDGRLAVLVHKPTDGFAAGRWALPGTFVRLNELLSDAALRALRDKAGVEGESPRQLRVVVPGRQQRLPYDHNAIVTEAVRWARAAYVDRPDPSGLLGESFTLYELRKLHEAVLGERETPGKDTFRRRMEGAGRGDR